MRPVRIDRPILWALFCCIFAGYCWSFASRSFAWWALASGVCSGISLCFATGYTIMWFEQARAGRPS